MLPQSLYLRQTQFAPVTLIIIFEIKKMSTGGQLNFPKKVATLFIIIYNFLEHRANGIFS